MVYRARQEKNCVIETIDPGRVKYRDEASSALFPPRPRCRGRAPHLWREEEFLVIPVVLDPDRLTEPDNCHGREKRSEDGGNITAASDASAGGASAGCTHACSI